MTIKTLLGAIAVLSLTVSPTLAATWDLSNEYPAGSLQGQTAEFFANAVAEKTEGEVVVTVHHGAALGYKSVDNFDAVGDGALQAASSAFVFWTGIDPIFQLSSLPFLAPTSEDVRDLYELAKPEYEKVLESNNQILLLATPWPSSGLWGNKAFTSTADLEGVKVRTYDVASTETIKNTGAFPIQISWADVSAQLSTNAIDAVLTSPNGGVGVQMWELQSDFTNLNYASSLQAIHLNVDAWNDLSESQQAAVKEAAAEAEAFGWGLLADATSKDFETMRENGMTVTEEVPSEFATALTAAAQPFIDQWLEETGERAQSIMSAYQKR
ncbi:solute-binding protein (plasmid) [Pseudosulfitobacter pseudonitzschiae]|uniref:Solute-binding protein n=1 Tax=Pseudosulfitobacter pseudonitzschiae TaxID=1402135 RepID=A0A221K957_9RHOB|nr:MULTISPECIES: TRAP transporter substrate-binding protein [Roseobacteraceae]ASM75505.1 solute-binding protein [Pseudosulfitobacter pseudonitzschiae]